MKRLSRTRWMRASAIALTGTVLQALPSCVPTGVAFREAAGPSIRTGVTQIVNGFLDGIFAIIEPEPQSSSD